MEAFARFLPADRDLPVTDHLSASLLALPMGSHVPPEVARRVAAAIRSAVPGATGVAGTSRVPASPGVAS
jgi:dTDP-4-amino-4,6-dideoxygalactose transaminase